VTATTPSDRRNVRRRRARSRAARQTAGLLDRAIHAARQKALALALREAQREQSDWIGPKHIALGLLRTDGVAARLLADHKVTRTVVQAACNNGPDQLAS
jgi:ATP-dependent Clp protease ATP-binding subunit ClpA